MDVTTKEGRNLASQLCFWSAFIDKIDDERKKLLLAVATYSDEAHNSYILLKNIANLSEAQPLEAYTIWMKMLEGQCTDYPSEAVSEILNNLVNNGPEGLRKARDIVSEYLKYGIERPAILLREIIDTNKLS